MAIAPPMKPGEFAAAIIKRTKQATPPQLKRAKSGSFDTTCAICMEAPRMIRLRPCGHASTCVACSLKLVDAKLRRISCPLCKRVATHCEMQEAAMAAAGDAGTLSEDSAAGGSAHGSTPSARTLVRMPTFDDMPDPSKQLTIVAAVKRIASEAALDKETLATAQKLVHRWSKTEANEANERLHEACAEGDVDSARQALADGANANAKDTSKYTCGELPLHRACGGFGSMFTPRDLGSGMRGAALELARLLRSHGANLEPKNEVGETPMHLAAQNGLLDVCKFLRSEGAGIEPTDDSAMRPLHHACQHGWLAVGRWLVEEEGVLLTCETDDDKIPLHYASEGGYLDVVQWLVGRDKKTLDAKDYSGVTPFMAACDEGKLSVAQWLHSQGADTRVVNINESDALQIACNYGHTEVVRWLLSIGVPYDRKDEDGADAVHLAFSSGHEACVQLLLEAGASMLNVLHDGTTALHGAAADGALALVELLLSNLSDDSMRMAAVNRRNRPGETPLLLACEANQLAVCKVLRRYGADVHLPNHDGLCPIHAAAASDDADDAPLVRWLIEQGASIDAMNPDEDNATPLHHACAADMVNVCKVLHSLGANLEHVCDNDGRRPVHTAVVHDSLEALKWWKEIGGSLTVEDGDGRSPLVLARAEFSRHCRAWLRRELEVAEQPGDSSDDDAGESSGDDVDDDGLFDFMGLFEDSSTSE